MRTKQPESVDIEGIVSKVLSRVRVPVDGERGEQGVPGERGPPGLNGFDGAKGRDGRDGKDGAQGPEGPAGRMGLTGKAGPSGKDGLNGWSPILSVESDEERRVLRVDDWFGGNGAKPPVGYIGAEGLVSSASAAVDIRGPAGQDGRQGAAGAAKREVFIGTAPNIRYPALIFEEMVVDGQSVYQMVVNA